MVTNPGNRLSKKNVRLWAAVIAACVIAFGIGWYVGNNTNQPLLPKSLRLTGYKYISPLLACNFNPAKIFPEYQAMSSAIDAVITAHEKAGDVGHASTYFFDLTNGRWSDTGVQYTYYPSSLGKIPIMMAYFEVAESSSSILQQRILYPVGSPDLNVTQDIPPSRSIIPGETYTVSDLITYMIEDSDNNAAQLLYDNVDQNALRGVYNDLQIPVNSDATIANLDFISPQQIATLFRVLYNSTYLSRDFSEEALSLMTDTSFTQGIEAGVPSSTPVAHKFGIVGIAPNGGTNTEHELHDCGLVYAPSHTYLLCVMTRGSAKLSAMESTIADISKTAYQTALGL